MCLSQSQSFNGLVIKEKSRKDAKLVWKPFGLISKKGLQWWLSIIDKNDLKNTISLVWGNATIKNLRI